MCWKIRDCVCVQCQSVLMIYLAQLAKVKLQKLHCSGLKFPLLIYCYNKDMAQVYVH